MFSDFVGKLIHLRQNNTDIEDRGMDCNPLNVLHAKPGTQNSPVAANNQESAGVPLLVALVKDEMTATLQRNLKAQNVRWPWKRVLLGAFANMREVSPSVRTEQIGPQCTDSHDIRYWGIFFGNLLGNSKTLQNRTRTTGILYEVVCTVMITYRWILHGICSVSDICTENQNALFFR